MSNQKSEAWLFGDTVWRVSRIGALTTWPIMSSNGKVPSKPAENQHFRSSWSHLPCHLSSLVQSGVRCGRHSRKARKHIAVMDPKNTIPFERYHPRHGCSSITCSLPREVLAYGAVLNLKACMKTSATLNHSRPYFHCLCRANRAVRGKQIDEYLRIVLVCTQ